MAKVDLFSLEFDEISMVPSGDNPSAHIVMQKADPKSLKLVKGTSSGTMPKGMKAHAFQPPATSDANQDACAASGCGGSKAQHKAMFGKAGETDTIEVPSLEDLTDAIDAWDTLAVDDRTEAQQMLLDVAERLDASDAVVESIKALPVSKA